MKSIGEYGLPNWPSERYAWCRQLREITMGNTAHEADRLKQRSMDFALAWVQLVEALPSGLAANTCGRQLIRSATSVAANDRAACRARSRAEFASKPGIAEEECDESQFWLEFIAASGMRHRDGLEDLIHEADELTAIFVASIRTSRRSSRPAGARRSAHAGSPQSAIQNPQSEIHTPRS